MSKYISYLSYIQGGIAIEANVAKCIVFEMTDIYRYNIYINIFNSSIVTYESKGRVDGWPVSVDGEAKLVFIYGNGMLQLGIMVEIKKNYSIKR